MARTPKESEEFAKLQQELAVSFQRFIKNSEQTQRQWAEAHSPASRNIQFAQRTLQLIEEEDNAFREYMRIRHRLFQRVLSDGKQTAEKSDKPRKPAKGS